MLTCKLLKYVCTASMTPFWKAEKNVWIYIQAAMLWSLIQKFGSRKVLNRSENCFSLHSEKTSLSVQTHNRSSASLRLTILRSLLLNKFSFVLKTIDFETRVWTSSDESLTFKVSVDSITILEFPSRRESCLLLINISKKFCESRW